MKRKTIFSKRLAIFYFYIYLYKKCQKLKLYDNKRKNYVEI